jgi:hypothetical protein
MIGCGDGWLGDEFQGAHNYILTFGFVQAPYHQFLSLLNELRIWEKSVKTARTALAVERKRLQRSQNARKLV